MDTATDLLTVKDLYRISVEGDRKELIDGVIVVSAPKPRHGVVRVRLIAALYAWTEESEGRGLMLDTTDVELDEHNLFNPDALWIAEEHRPADLSEYPERVPDICVEIQSPGTWRLDRGKKKDGYERGGCPELWLVDHVERHVLVYRRSRPESPTYDIELVVEDELTSPQLPGFALAVERLFAGL